MEFTRRDGIIIGCFQALALVPGVSRSGATISAGLFLDFDRTAAARYSFLLSVPAACSPGLFELRHVGEGGGASAGATALATLLAFVTGYASIAFLLRYLVHHSIGIFAAYRIALGLIVLVLASRRTSSIDHSPVGPDRSRALARPPDPSHSGRLADYRALARVPGRRGRAGGPRPPRPATTPPRLRGRSRRWRSPPPSAMLHGTVDTGRQRTTYWFEVGPTTAYGAEHPAGHDQQEGDRPVQERVSALVKGKTYHARLVARNDDGLSLGADRLSTAGAIPTPGTPAPLPGNGKGKGEVAESATPRTRARMRAPATTPDAGNDAGSTPVLAPPAPPGLRARASPSTPQTGNVLVRLPGARTHSVALLDTAASIRSGPSSTRGAARSV